MEQNYLDNIMEIFYRQRHKGLRKYRQPLEKNTAMQ